MKWLVNWSETVLDATVRRIVPVTGGDINQAQRVEFEDGRAVFVKWNRAAPPGMFTAEAQALEWLREPGAITVPEVLACAEGLPAEIRAEPNETRAGPASSGSLSALMLEYLEPCTPTPRLWEDLGRRLAALHDSSARVFGALPDNFVGTLLQDNAPTDSWASFWIERRLEPQFRRAVDDGRAPDRWRKALPKLYETLRQLIVEPRFPERIHGDLWSGNCLFCKRRGAALIDPAAYAGHGEVDLAMMQLFGGFDERVWGAYLETRGELMGLDERLEMYRLYPLLVHANLFGGSYVQAVDALVRGFS